MALTSSEMKGTTSTSHSTWPDASHVYTTDFGNIDITRDVKES